MSKGNVLDNYRAKHGAFNNDPLFQALQTLHGFGYKKLKWHTKRHSISGTYPGEVKDGAYNLASYALYYGMRWTFMRYDFATGSFEVGVSDG